MITPDLQKQIQDALKAKDELRLSTLRMLSSSFNYERIALQHDLSEEEELNVVRREVKKRKDAIQAYQQAGNDQATNDLPAQAGKLQSKIAQEQKELAILEEFLPPAVSQEEIDKTVDEAIAQGTSEMGKVIGMVKAKLGANADGAQIAASVKAKLLGK